VPPPTYTEVKVWFPVNPRYRSISRFSARVEPDDLVDLGKSEVAALAADLFPAEIAATGEDPVPVVALPANRIVHLPGTVDAHKDDIGGGIDREGAVGVQGDIAEPHRPDQPDDILQIP